MRLEERGRSDGVSSVLVEREESAVFVAAGSDFGGVVGADCFAGSAGTGRVDWSLVESTRTTNGTASSRKKRNWSFMGAWEGRTGFSNGCATAPDCA